MIRGAVFSYLKGSLNQQSIRFYRVWKKPRDLAGVRHQQKALNEVDAFVDDPEMDLEADFTKLNRTHRQHEAELKRRREQIRLFTVKNKYFKAEKQPNLLTWAEKEQIRYLHKEQPDEWTIEKLAESFPATEETIVKIINAKWTPANMKRIQKHDESVKQSWQLFKTNNLPDLDPNLRQHLQKFSNRNFDSVANAYVQTDNEQIKFKFPTPKSKEFSSIITSCKAYYEKPKSILDSGTGALENKSSIEATIEKASIEGNEDSVKEKTIASKLPKKLQRKNMTFEELRQNLPKASFSSAQEEMHLSVSSSTQQKPSFDNNSNSDEIAPAKQITLSPPVPKSMSNIDKNEKQTINLTLADIQVDRKIQKYETKSVAVKNMKNDANLLEIREKIVIPTKLYKKGAKYKLYDCFYDDRGSFLFRVPGLM